MLLEGDILELMFEGDRGISGDTALDGGAILALYLVERERGSEWMTGDEYR